MAIDNMHLGEGQSIASGESERTMGYASLAVSSRAFLCVSTNLIYSYSSLILYSGSSHPFPVPWSPVVVHNRHILVYIGHVLCAAHKIRVSSCERQKNGTGWIVQRTNGQFRTGCFVLFLL